MIYQGAEALFCHQNKIVDVIHDVMGPSHTPKSFFPTQRIDLVGIPSFMKTQLWEREHMISSSHSLFA